MNRPIDLLLYGVTDRSWLNGAGLEEQVEKAIRGGVSVIQLREKNISTREFYQIALKVKEVTDKYGVPLIVNDRLDITLAINAVGLHVGQSDLPAVIARKILGPDKILGVSVTNQSEALTAENDGADYLGAGAVFTTQTKKDSLPVDNNELCKITSAVNLPVVAIGGINETNVHALKGSGIKGIAVISAVFGKPDVETAARNMRKISEVVLQQ